VGLVSTGPDGKDLPPEQWYDPELGLYFMAYWSADHIARCREIERQNRRQRAADEALAQRQKKKADADTDESYRRWLETPTEGTQGAIARIEALSRDFASAQAEIIEIKVRLARLEEILAAGKPAKVARIPRRTGGGEGPQAA
jgi:hypothetical protein